MSCASPMTLSGSEDTEVCPEFNEKREHPNEDDFDSGFLSPFANPELSQFLPPKTPFMVHASESKGIHVGPAFYFTFGSKEGLEENQDFLKSLVQSPVLSHTLIEDDPRKMKSEGYETDHEEQPKKVTKHLISLVSQTSEASSHDMSSSSHQKPYKCVDKEFTCGYESFPTTGSPTNQSYLKTDLRPVVDSPQSKPFDYEGRASTPPKTGLTSREDFYSNSRPCTYEGEDNTPYPPLAKREKEVFCGSQSNRIHSAPSKRLEDPLKMQPHYQHSEPCLLSHSSMSYMYQSTNPFLSSSPEPSIHESEILLTQQPVLHSPLSTPNIRMKQSTPKVQSFLNSPSAQCEDSFPFKEPPSVPRRYEQRPSPFTFEKVGPRDRASSSPTHSDANKYSQRPSPATYQQVRPRDWTTSAPDLSPGYSTGQQYVNHEEIDTRLQRVRIVERRGDTEWVEMGQKYIESGGFRLGLPDGLFFRTPYGYFVEMINGIRYSIILNNMTSLRCNFDLYVDEKLVFLSQLMPREVVELDGPQGSDRRFVFLRAKDAPQEAGIRPDFEGNGVIKAVFTPEVPGDGRRRGSHGPQVLNKSFTTVLNQLLDQARPTEVQSPTTPEYRSANISMLCSGATALQGLQRKKELEKADDLLIDQSHSVVLQLRLLARRDDPSTPSQREEICPLSSLRPPRIEDLFHS